MERDSCTHILFSKVVEPWFSIVCCGDSLSVPYKVRKTFASVPAPHLCPVKMLTVYVTAGKKANENLNPKVFDRKTSKQPYVSLHALLIPRKSRKTMTYIGQLSQDCETFSAVCVSCRDLGDFRNCDRLSFLSRNVISLAEQYPFRDLDRAVSVPCFEHLIG